MWKLLKRLDVYLDYQVPALLLLVTLVVLRLPHFFEPYWYGDEAIYLTIGNTLRQGKFLYAEIIDHKTPLIYYLAMTPSQLWFRILLLIWSAISTLLFVDLVKKCISQRWLVFLTSLAFVILTSLPWYEGNIPNGELFVIGFVLAGVWFLTRTEWWQHLIAPAKTKTFPGASRSETLWLLASGSFFGLAILTKVPALFDLIGWLSLAWFGALSILVSSGLPSTVAVTPAWFKSRWSLLWPVIWRTGVVVVGALALIMVSILYFGLRGSFAEYLDFGLLYNFRYAGSWNLPFTNPALVFAFSLPGKVLILALVVLVVTGLRRWLDQRWQLVIVWFACSLLASLLSNRPYPHYFMQVLPPAILLVGMGSAALWEVLHQRSRAALSSLMLKLAFPALAIWLVWMIPRLLAGGANPLYPTVSYYQRWWALIRNERSATDYRNSFDSLMADNYRAADIITGVNPDEIFIWGTNPTLYALTGTSPTGRFTVSFHIHDFQAYDETMQAVLDKEPAFIVVMKHEKVPLPGLNYYLSENYMPNTSFEHFTLWKRRGLGQ